MIKPSGLVIVVISLSFPEKTIEMMQNAAEHLTVDIDWLTIL